MRFRHTIVLLILMGSFAPLYAEDLSAPARQLADKINASAGAGSAMAITYTNASSLTPSQIADIRLALESQLRNADLAQYFEQKISVDQVQRFKPHPIVYQNAAAQMNVSPSLACLVAAHSWDIYGAMNAGLTAAFIQRPGKVLFPYAPEPAFTATDLTNLAEQLKKK